VNLLELARLVGRVHAAQGGPEDSAFLRNQEGGLETRILDQLVRRDLADAIRAFCSRMPEGIEVWPGWFLLDSEGGFHKWETVSERGLGPIRTMIPEATLYLLIAAQRINPVLKCIADALATDPRPVTQEAARHVRQILATIEAGEQEAQQPTQLAASTTP
jgi:hypothetical protein